MFLIHMTARAILVQFEAYANERTHDAGTGTPILEKLDPVYLLNDKRARKKHTHA